jgi:hypothetical protein
MFFSIYKGFSYFRKKDPSGPALRIEGNVHFLFGALEQAEQLPT